MIRDASHHRQGLLGPCHAQTLLRCAEVLDGTDQGHAMLQGQRAAHQSPSSARQRRQTLAERRVQVLNVCGVAHPRLAHDA
jgi:ABC-type methionine transport system ATPase subunit